MRLCAELNANVSVLTNTKINRDSFFQLLALC